MIRIMATLHLLLLIWALSPVLGGELTNSGWSCGDQEWDDQFICDGIAQCDDDSDEGAGPGEGCNLYPESGCPSHGGVRRWRCGRTGQCLERREEQEECEQGEGGYEPPGGCRLRPGGQEGWRCRDGRCVEAGQVCDGREDCEDGSDEARAPWRGCNLFPNFTDWCPSWGGQRHVSCPPNEATCIPVTRLASINNTDPASCHVCPDPSMWRCNNGQCISGELRGDGVPDCVDGSDETRVRVRWYDILISTLVSVFLLLVISFLLKNEIVTCVSHGDEVDGVEDSQEDSSLYPDSDIPGELIKLLDDKENWDISDKVASNASDIQLKSLKTGVYTEAMKKYLLVKRDTIQYHHLYMYLAARYPTVPELGLVTKQLLKWEMSLHDMSKREVLRFWRLHLGTSHQTGVIISSVADQNKCIEKLEATCYPVRTSLRNCWRKLHHLKPLEDDTIYQIVSLIYSAFVPFIEGCFFLAERIKNFLFTHIFLTALSDLSRGEPMKHPFDFFLIVAMSISIAVTQILHILYSIYYSEEIFEYGKKATTLKKCLMKVFAGFLSPVVPIFILANHIYHDAVLHRTRRLLQTLKDPDLSEDKSTQDSNKEINLEEENLSSKNESYTEGINLYKTCCKEESKSLLFRKLYSYFRVTSAVLESCTTMVTLFLLLLVTGRSNREINLVEGVEQKLYSFFNIKNSSGFLSELNVMRDVVILGSVLYSLAIVLTALVKYWYQSKNLAISVKGQFTLGLYMFCLTLNKLTTIVSLFSNSQPLQSKKGDNPPSLTLTMAIIIFSILTIIRLGLVYVYKCFFSAGQNGWDQCRGGEKEEQQERVPRGWETGDHVDKWVNVLINSVVVTPFMVHKQPLEVLKTIEKKFNVSKESQGSQIRSNISTEGIMKHAIDDIFREQILSIWEEDPNTKLSVETVRKKMFDQRSMRITLALMSGEFVDDKIKKTLESLEETGLVNQPLLNPVPTKREYFWLFIIVALENIITLCIELASGGIWTTKVDRYDTLDIPIDTYSWAL